MTTISEVPRAAISTAVNAVFRHIKKALRSGQGDATNMQEFMHALDTGRMSLWAVHDEGEIQAVAGLSVTQYATGRKVFVHVLAGSGMDEWGDQMERALQDCRDVTGSMCVEASCRPGLAKYLKKRGWKTKAVIMEAPE